MFLLLEEAVISDAGFLNEEVKMSTIHEVERRLRRCPVVYSVSLYLLWKDKTIFCIWGLPKYAKTSLDWLELKGGLGGVNALVWLSLAVLRTIFM